MEGIVTPSQLMASTVPQWQEEEAFVDPVSNLKKRPIPPRRVYPLNVNMPAARNKFDGRDEIEMLSVGTGAPVYMEPEDSDETVHRFRSLKSVSGEGAEVLKGAEGGDFEILFKRIKEKNDSPFTVTDEGEVIRVGGNDVDQFININIGGSIQTKDGLIETITEGTRGGWGKLSTLGCDDTSPEELLEWREGFIINGSEDNPADLILELGECQTDSAGS